MAVVVMGVGACMEALFWQDCSLFLLGAFRGLSTVGGQQQEEGQQEEELQLVVTRCWLRCCRLSTASRVWGARGRQRQQRLQQVVQASTAQMCCRATCQAACSSHTQLMQCLSGSLCVC